MVKKKCDSPSWPQIYLSICRASVATVTQFYLSWAKATSHTKGFVPGDPLREYRVILHLEVFHHRHWSQHCCVRGTLLGSFPSHLIGNSIFWLWLVHSCRCKPSAKPSHLNRLPPEQSQSSLNVIARLQRFRLRKKKTKKNQHLKANIVLSMQGHPPGLIWAMMTPCYFRKSAVTFGPREAHQEKSSRFPFALCLHDY